MHPSGTPALVGAALHNAGASHKEILITILARIQTKDEAAAEMPFVSAMWITDW